jgi:hypothetical protein
VTWPHPTAISARITNVSDEIAAKLRNLTTPIPSFPCIFRRPYHSVFSQSTSAHKKITIFFVALGVGLGNDVLPDNHRDAKK